MGVMFQAFYWDCPSLESREHKWWVEVKSRIPSLKQFAGGTTRVLYVDDNLCVM